MLGLKRRQLSPAEEAARQSAILTEIERQREERAANDRRLTAEVAMRKRAMWAEQVEERERKRMEAMAAPLREKQQREEREREQSAKRSEEKMRVYHEAKAKVDSLDQQIAQLRGRDLTPLEAAELVGLKELRKTADAELRQAEIGVGRHRVGGW